MVLRKAARSPTHFAVAPHQLIDEAFAPEYLVEQHAHIMAHVPVEVHHDGAGLREELAHEDKPRRKHPQIGRCAGIRSAQLSDAAVPPRVLIRRPRDVDGASIGERHRNRRRVLRAGVEGRIDVDEVDRARRTSGEKPREGLQIVAVQDGALGVCEWCGRGLRLLSLLACGGEDAGQRGKQGRGHGDFLPAVSDEVSFSVPCPLAPA